MNIIIPIGGIGARFQQEGYTRPKPLINVLGKPMIYHVIDNLVTTQNDTIYIFYNGDLDKYNFENEIINRNNLIKLVRQEHRTNGAAETVLKGLETLSDKELDKKTMTIDCDTFYTDDIVAKYRKQTDNAIFCFFDTLKDPIYSYVALNDEAVITDIKEKEKISNYANTGCYCFSSGKILKEYCEKTKKDFDEGKHTQKELYMSGVIKKMIEDKLTFRANIISEESFHCLGTPFQVKVFCKEYGRQFTCKNKMRICFDLDNTLVTYPEIIGDYTTVRPNVNVIKMCKYLKSLGHDIIIYTARRMRTYEGNVGACIANIGQTTFDTLKKFGIPYDEIYFGKPYANFYIDDLGIDPRFNLERELGIYMTEIQERDFNTITTCDKMITKRGPRDKIRGEIYWYENIPKSINHLFPTVHEKSKMQDMYTMEKICGVSLSYQYATETMSEKMLINYLETIDIIHNSSTNYDNINIYANYSDKISQRYINNDYTQYEDHERVYDVLMKFFDEYEKDKRGKISVIHGDPVFSNCILDEYCRFKFIDMRGIIGDTLSIFGDKWYDYGKIYQSLIGYDEILLDKRIGIDYKRSMIQTFEKYVERKYGIEIMTDIKMITYSLIFTLLPLHNNEKCKNYYKMIQV